MYRRLLPLLSILSFSLSVMGQISDPLLYRTIDGSSNNLDQIGWGAAGENLLRRTTVGYQDGISMPAGPNRPNPRVISNALFAQDGLINDPLGLSDFCWVWGQFLDHDIGITPDGTEDATIAVPTGDLWFDPLGMGQAIIPMHRNVFATNTGTSTDNPRQHLNMITAFIDGSAVYGSDEERANWLRSLIDGKLKVSAGDLPPFNTFSGEFEDDIDHSAPEMDNPVGLTDKVFVTGDVRANENPLLLSFHTLFIREHNRLCDLIITEHPDWTDEMIYQHARKLVGGIIQSIVYEAWLPAMGVELPPYAGYQSDVDPGLMNVFTAAAFRLGHTLLNGIILRKSTDGETMPQGNLTLRDAFFNPMIVYNDGSIDPFFQGMATQTQQTLDSKVIDDVRNFLFGPPGAGGLDLASININRGRERGLPDFNTVRENFGLTTYSFFPQITSNALVSTKLLSLYGSINSIDPWVGMLSEDPMPGALFGPTIMAIMKRQFQALRDGDRFYYENDPVLTNEEKTWIKNTTLHDVIMQNTDIKLMQDDVFKSMPHSEICNNMTVDIFGGVFTTDQEPILNVSVQVSIAGNTQETFSGAAGRFDLTELPACDVESLSLVKNDDLTVGVTTFDIILISKHVLGIDPLNSPYKMVAADVDNSGSINILDMIHLRKAILNISVEFPNNNSWKFIPAGFEFTDPDNPLEEDIPQTTDYEHLTLDLEQIYYGIKIGDINGTVDPFDDENDNIAVDIRESEMVYLNMDNPFMSAEEEYQIVVRSEDLTELIGYQFALEYNTQDLNIVSVTPHLDGLTKEHFGIFQSEGLITTSWNTNTGIKENDLFSMQVQPLKDGKLSDFIRLNQSKVVPAAYRASLQTSELALDFSELIPETERFTLYQNVPNPFIGNTLIEFYLDEGGEVTQSLYEASGRLVSRKTSVHGAGKQIWNINADELPHSGLYFYKVQTATNSATKKMYLVASQK